METQNSTNVAHHSPYMYWVTFYNCYTSMELTVEVQYSALTEEDCTEWDALKVARHKLATYGCDPKDWYGAAGAQMLNCSPQYTAHGPTVERYSLQYSRERLDWTTGLFYKKF